MEDDVFGKNVVEERPNGVAELRREGWLFGKAGGTLMAVLQLRRIG